MHKSQTEFPNQKSTCGALNQRTFLERITTELNEVSSEISQEEIFNNDLKAQIEKEDQEQLREWLDLLETIQKQKELQAKKIKLLQNGQMLKSFESQFYEQQKEETSIGKTTSSSSSSLVSSVPLNRETMPQENKQQFSKKHHRSLPNNFSQTQTQTYTKKKQVYENNSNNNNNNNNNNSSNNKHDKRFFRSKHNSQCFQKSKYFENNSNKPLNKQEQKIVNNRRKYLKLVLPIEEQENLTALYSPRQIKRIQQKRSITRSVSLTKPIEPPKSTYLQLKHCKTNPLPLLNIQKGSKNKKIYHKFTTNFFNQIKKFKVGLK
ncbi:hypothetical protein M0813_23500 [Anaeramoeba flamelloides]|uniref:Uncharacterized protein n=1 Tax=Anaeramoeba flamelloides TaxID=1746091 RepID=A0ABQ8YAI0_9EUKA|nr:hypothetical protein M0813_23500 [Anaeramoeba flamelloides]